MKGRGTRFLAVLLAVGLLAGIPSSAQLLPGESDEEGSLGMLVLINQMDLSIDQMETLHRILTEMLTARAEVQGSSDAFRQSMISFDGTPEELEALLQAFRQEQRVLLAGIGTVWAASLHEIGDLLTVNQGLVLAAALPIPRSSLATPRGRPAQDAPRRAIGEDEGVRSRIQERLAELSKRLPDDRMDRMATWRAQRLGDEAMADRRHPQGFAEAMERTPLGPGGYALLSRAGETGPLHAWIDSFVLALEAKLEAMTD
jgi:hypothetical protein